LHIYYNIIWFTLPIFGNLGEVFAYHDTLGINFLHLICPHEVFYRMYLYSYKHTRKHWISHLFHAYCFFYSYDMVSRCVCYLGAYDGSSFNCLYIIIFNKHGVVRLYLLCCIRHIVWLNIIIFNKHGVVRLYPLCCIRHIVWLT